MWSALLGLFVLLAIFWAFVGTYGSSVYASAQAQSGVRIWSLEDLGFQTVDLTTLLSPPRLSFELPADAKQGPSEWYIFHLHYAIEFHPESSGHGSFSVFTNDRAANQVTFDTIANQLPRYSTVGLVSGYLSTQADGYTIEDHYSNYLQLEGVQGGGNVLTVTMEFEPTVRLNALTIYADSFLERTTASPYTLAVHMPNRIGKLEPGRPFTIPYSVTAESGRVVRDVRVRSDVSDGLRVVGPIVQRIGDISGERGGEFDYEASASGRYRVTLTAQGAGFNQPQQTVEFVVGESAWSPSLYTLLGVGGLAIVLCWFAFRKRLRRRRGGSVSRRLLAAVGLSAMSIAAVLSLVSFDRGDNWCGSAARPNRSGEACADAVHDRRQLVAGLAFLGAGLALGGVRRRAISDARTRSRSHS